MYSIRGSKISLKFKKMMQNSRPGIQTLTEGKEGFIPCATSTRSLRLGHPRPIIRFTNLCKCYLAFMGRMAKVKCPRIGL